LECPDGERYSSFAQVSTGFRLNRPGLYKMALKVAWYSSTGALVRQSYDWLTIGEQQGPWCRQP
jgi:hypothetical protein